MSGSASGCGSRAEGGKHMHGSMEAAHPSRDILTGETRRNEMAEGQKEGSGGNGQN